MNKPLSTDRSSGDQQIPRARRFAIRTPLLYRESGQGAWSEGTTVNISRSGVLFRSQRMIVPESMLEFLILFPAEITGGMPADVVCSGPVVRNEPPDGTAAAIQHYRFKKHSTP